MVEYGPAALSCHTQATLAAEPLLFAFANVLQLPSDDLDLSTITNQLYASLMTLLPCIDFEMQLPSGSTLLHTAFQGRGMPWQILHALADAAGTEHINVRDAQQDTVLLSMLRNDTINWAELPTRVEILLDAGLDPTLLDREGASFTERVLALPAPPARNQPARQAYEWAVNFAKSSSPQHVTELLV